MRLIVAAAIILTMNTSENRTQPRDSVRPMAVAGQFYPDSKKETEVMLEEFFEHCANVKPDGNAVAVIVPHAGYVFSGQVAAMAYSTLPETKVYEHIFLIGPSHHVSFDGASINSEYAFYETPLGRVEVDTDLCGELSGLDSCLTFRHDAHSKEHCLEVQLPFLQHRLVNMPPIVPIILGTQRFSVIKALAGVLKPYLNKKNLFVISSDFSHYPSYSDAEVADGRTGDAIASGDPARFLEALKANFDARIPNLATSACGLGGILTLMLMTQNDSSFVYNHLSYLNSGDSSYGEKGEVVGYHAFSVSEFGPSDGLLKSGTGFCLADDEKTALLGIARKSIEVAFKGETVTDSWAGIPLTDKMLLKTGAFVTLNENGHLRGCVGHFGQDVPLFKVVAEMARAAAFEDTRFPEVRESEMPKIEIEISVLSPLKRISGSDEFNYGKEGIYMVKNGRSGTFLPQVADEVQWTKEEFLGHCAKDKAGIGWDGWKTAELYTYEAVIFKESL